MIGIPGSLATSSLATTDSMSLRSKSFGGFVAGTPLALSSAADAFGDNGEALTGLRLQRDRGLRPCTEDPISGRHDASSAPPLKTKSVVDLHRAIKLDRDSSCQFLQY
jgi:hypothetical protein